MFASMIPNPKLNWPACQSVYKHTEQEGRIGNQQSPAVLVCLSSTKYKGEQDYGLLTTTGKLLGSTTTT